MEVFNIICGVCSITGLLVSIFTAGKVVKISQTVNIGNVDDHPKTVNRVSKSEIHDSYVGRDSINGTRNSK